MIVYIYMHALYPLLAIAMCGVCVHAYTFECVVCIAGMDIVEIIMCIPRLMDGI